MLWTQGRAGREQRRWCCAVVLCFPVVLWCCGAVVVLSCSSLQAVEGRAGRRAGLRAGILRCAVCVVRWWNGFRCCAGERRAASDGGWCQWRAGKLFTAYRQGSCQSCAHEKALPSSGGTMAGRAVVDVGSCALCYLVIIARRDCRASGESARRMISDQNRSPFFSLTALPS